ncbi:outer membrane protein transport protein [Myxococcota bacterium]|nr:outer membrane protein transport protein [Myxococcota bacterium]
MKRSLILWMVLAGIPVPGLAGGFSNPDFGIRRMGMFAVTARPDDTTAVFHNPAGLTLLDGTHFYHTQSWFVMQMGMRLYDSQGVLRPDKEIRPTWSVGAIPFLGFQSDCGTRDFRLGFGIYAPNAYGAALPEDAPTRYYDIQALFLASRATLAAAYRVSDIFSFGVAVNLVHVFLTKKYYLNKKMLPLPNIASDSPAFDLRFEPAEKTGATDMLMEIDGQDWTWALDAGVLIRPHPTFRIGAAFSGGSPITLDGRVKLTGSTCPPGSTDCTLKGHLGEVLADTRHKTRMLIPFELKAGFNWEPLPWFEFGMDIYYWHYQSLQEQTTRFREPLLGLIQDLPDQKDYHNSWAWNVGVMFRPVRSVDLMMGYQMDFSPIPEQTYSLDNPSTDQKGISLGLRWRVDDRWRVGLGYVHNWANLINVQRSVGKPPANGKGHAANNEFAFDFSYRF